MLPSERQKIIISILEKQDVLTINEIVEKFNISIETVRRDFNILEKQGKLEKVYGGARLKKTSIVEPALDERLIDNIRLKEAIGRKCAEIINDGDSLYIDSGTTTFQITKYLKEKNNLTVITNSLPVVTELSDTDFDLLLIGGMYRKSERSIVAFNYMFNFESLNISKAFFCAGGISVEKGISDYSFHEVETKKELLKQSKEVFVVADSSKFGKDVLINFTSFSNIDHLIVDDELEDKKRKALDSVDIDLILAQVEA